MHTKATYIPYSDTQYFSKLVTDYLQNSKSTENFISEKPTLDGIKNQIEKRKDFPYRKELTAVLDNQYANLSVNKKIKENIESLKYENTFSIITAHQPNIFTGPLYFIYKIIHTIKLAHTLKQELPEYNFVPVYYMGSEDADLDELNNISIEGKKYIWHTEQKGAVGRMKVDKKLLSLINEMQMQIGVQPFGDELILLFKNCYTENETIQTATLKLVSELFGQYGLITIIPDNVELKELFSHVVAKEITEQFSHKLVQQTATELEEEYKVQTLGRDINLFYIDGDIRERIELIKDEYSVYNSDLSFSKNEILQLLETNPEKFSANVILRPVFQETILPNIAFIGGGGELAYWMELKKIFEAVNVPYPVLLLRNSFLLINKKEKQLLEKLQIDEQLIFQPSHIILKNIIDKLSENKLLLDEEHQQLEEFYKTVENKSAAVDSTLSPHVQSLKAKAIKLLTNLEKKIYRAEKRKLGDIENQVTQLKSTLFPNKSLQERIENFASFYAKTGSEFIDTIYKNSLSLEQMFAVVDLEK